MARFAILSILLCALSMALAAEDDKFLSKKNNLESSKLLQQDSLYHNLPVQKLVGKVAAQDNEARQVLINKIYYSLLHESCLKKTPLMKLFIQPIGSDLSHKELVVYIVLSHAQQIPLPEAIFRLLEKRIAQKDPDAQFVQGWMYENKYGVPLENLDKSLKIVIKWYKKAAKQGHPAAQYHLSCIYLERLDVPTKEKKKNTKIGLKWLIKAAENDYSVAQNALGRMFLEKRLGVADLDQGEKNRNVIAAVECFRKAAEQGNSYAQFNLGKMYEEGRSVPTQNEMEKDKIIYDLYKKAAEQGNLDAQERLGLIHEYHRGVPSQDQKENIKMAIKWYARAAESGGKDSSLRYFFSAVPLSSNLKELSPSSIYKINQLSQELMNLNDIYADLAAISNVTSSHKNTFNGNKCINQAALKVISLLTSYQELLEHVQEPLFMLQCLKPHDLRKYISSASLEVFLPGDAKPYISLDGPSITILQHNELETSLRSISETIIEMTKLIDNVGSIKSKRVLLELSHFEDDFDDHTRSLWAQIKNYLGEDNKRSQELLGGYLAQARKELQEKLQEISTHILYVRNVNGQIINLIGETAPYRDYLFINNVWKNMEDFVTVCQL